jgi:superfamily II DNA or RNA helicase
MVRNDARTLMEQISFQERRLAELQQLYAAETSRLASLKTELNEALSEPLIHVQPTLPLQMTGRLSPIEKLQLFRSLFRGRDDVYPKLWINAQKKRKGYSPACAREWQPGICQKPRIKCGECPHQAFSPVTDQVVLGHLQGRHVIGVYPLLPDETCWFLAVDFDKQAWADDVAAFTETCRRVGLPYAVERSRSGNGAHVWFFFDSPLPASIARSVGCYLITETMARRHQLAMESYDRLFPNQDSMPRGGFGNLIALPLQHQARQANNTLFLDDQLEPYADQWAFLASLPRLSKKVVEAVAAEAGRLDRIIGVPVVEGDEQQVAPWLRLPSGRLQHLPLLAQRPEQVRAVLAQRLFIEKGDLPSALLNQVKRQAAFQNPEFYKKQRLRLSTRTTPRVIALAEEVGDYISLPRGCQTRVEDVLRHYQIPLTVEDHRNEGQALSVEFHGELTDSQKHAAKAMLGHDIGIFVAPPGVGKTVLGIYLLATRRRNTLILVHRAPLLDQWKAQLQLFLGIDKKSIGQMGSGKHKPTGSIDVATIQSLVHGGSVDDVVAQYGHVIVDECHHIPASSFERVLAEVKARYITGLTGTLQRRDGQHPIAEMHLGPPRFCIQPKSQAARRPFEQVLVIRPTRFQMPPVVGTPRIQDLYSGIAFDSRRNAAIIGDVEQALSENRCPVILTERKEHLQLLAERLQASGHEVVVLMGGMKAKAKKTALQAVSSGGRRVIIATGRFLGEGFDDPRLDTLFLAMPVAWKGTLIQYAGRLHRIHPNKREVRIYDYVDSDVPMLLNMFQKRLKAYRAIGYEQRTEQSDQTDAGEQLPLSCL